MLRKFIQQSQPYVVHFNKVGIMESTRDCDSWLYLPFFFGLFVCGRVGNHTNPHWKVKAEASINCHH